MNKAELWDVEVRILWSKNYDIELSKLLEENGVKSILDTSGGTGYPSIEFAKMGWDISYADGSLEMYDFFTKKLKEKELTVPSFLVKWQNLNSKIDKKYDALLCRGNSFIYMDGYDVNTYNPLTVKENMQHSLSQFYNQLNFNGVLYIDLLKQNKVKNNDVVEQEMIFETYSTLTKVFFNEETNVRIITEFITLFKDNSKKQINVCSYPLSEKELKHMLLEAGFVSVEKVEIESSEFTDSFLARK